jgi:O-methyltransferase
MANAKQLIVMESFAPEQGHCFVCPLPSAPAGDTADDPHGSGVEIFEDGRALGPGHSAHDAIRRDGSGRYSHWHDVVYFSASDNTDPRRNRRRYMAYVPETTVDPDRRRLQNLVAQASAATASPLEAYALAEALFYAVYPGAFLGESSKACWDDSDFVADYLRLCAGNRRSFERKYLVAELVKGLGHVAGDLAECGVYTGATAFFMLQACRAAGHPRSLHLFDSFEGLSAPESPDGAYWRGGDLAVPEAEARATLAGFDDVHVYRGWIPDRFSEVADRRFAFVHIDVDLYQPTLDSLAFFYPRVSPGGIIVCDDYGFTTCPGATQAVTEFMRDKPERVAHLPTGQGVVFCR